MFAEIEIINFDVFNPPTFRRDNPSWFRMNRDVGNAQGLYGLTAEQKWVWVMILAERCKKKTSIIKVSLSWLENETLVPIEHIIDALEKLNENGTIKYRRIATRSESRSEIRGETVGEIRSTNERTNERTNVHAQPIPKVTDRLPENLDFEAIYKNYPRKAGKSAGLKVCVKQIKTEDDYQLLDLAVLNYREYCKKRSIEERYVKYFSTFMSEWRDWTDPTHGDLSIGTKPKILGLAEPMPDWAKAKT